MLGTWAAVGAAVGAAQDLSPGAELAQRQFRDVDADRDGLATATEIASYADLVIVSMEFDGSGDPTEGEFTSWGFGLQNLADAAGTRQGYDTALRVVFDDRDRDNDAEISKAELGGASAASCACADTGGDLVLDQAELTDDVLLDIVLRTALTVAP